MILSAAGLGRLRVVAADDVPSATRAPRTRLLSFGGAAPLLSVIAAGCRAAC